MLLIYYLWQDGTSYGDKTAKFKETSHLTACHIALNVLYPKVMDPETRGKGFALRIYSVVTMLLIGIVPNIRVDNEERQRRKTLTLRVHLNNPVFKHLAARNRRFSCVYLKVNQHQESSLSIPENVGQAHAIVDHILSSLRHKS